jgi:hypothetical protein
MTKKNNDKLNETLMLMCPAHTKEEIDANPLLWVAFVISEEVNPNHPISWHQYLKISAAILKGHYVIRKHGDTGFGAQA